MMSSRFLPQFIVVLILSAALGIFALQAGEKPGAVHASAGASLMLPEANCAPTVGNTATVNFTWQPVIGKTQWLDISTDEWFAPGSFKGHGPLQMELSSLTVQNLPANTVHYWRLNTLSESGWSTSETGAFVPCGAPVLLWAPVSCDGKYFARVNFRWAPSAEGIAAQYLDLGFDPWFAPGSFVNTHGLLPAVDDFGWNGIHANVWTYFRVNALGTDGVWRTSTTGGFNAECVPPVNPNLYGSADRLLMPRLGIDAPVNVRDVGFDGAMGDPAGPEDVVRYTFPVFDGVGGYPGNGGSTLIAGHLDFRNYGLAVFAPLGEVEVGDIAQYIRGDGVVVNYSVVWFADMPNDFGFGELALNTSADTLVLITCAGDFNWNAEEYSHRRVVFLTRVQ